MFKVVVGHSNDPDSESAIDEILEQCNCSLAGEIPKAGILLAAIDFDHALVLQRIDRDFPGIALVGGTSVGEMSSVLEFQEDSLTLMLFCSDEIEISAGVGYGCSENVRAATKQAVEQAQSQLSQKARLCLTFPEGLATDGVAIVEGLELALEQSVPIFGGLAGDDWKFEKTYQFFGTEVLRDSVPVLLFSGNILVSTNAASGQYPIGRKGIVTKAKDYTVYEIDGKNALLFYHEYFGEFDIAGAFSIGSTVAVYEPNEKNYYLRSPYASNEEIGSVSYFARVPEQATIQLTKTSHQDLLIAGKTALLTALNNYPGSEPTAALIVSCSSRLKNLGTRTKEEYQIVKNLIGDVPNIGFHSFGEICPFEPQGQSYFHNETFTIMLLGVK